MLQKFFVAATCLLSITQATSQPSITNPDSLKTPAEITQDEIKSPALTVTGSVDAYFKYDLDKTRSNTFTSFTQSHNSFSLGMASLKFEHNSEKISAGADIGFGPRVKEFSYTDEGITQAIKQLYISYSPAEWIKLTAGSWATHVGYELLDPQLNRNYSMSYMFTNGPFSHTGIKADLTKGKHAVMIGISNPTDFRVTPEGYINKKFLLAQYSLSLNDNIKFYLNYVGGQSPDTSKTSQLDAVITWKLHDKFSVAYNGTLTEIKSWDGIKNLDSKSWWGSALYLNYDPADWIGLTYRAEYFNDENHLKLAMAPDGCTMFASTLSVNLKVNSFIFIPEIRFDHASQDIFTDKNGQLKQSATNILLAAIYSF